MKLTKNQAFRLWQVLRQLEHVAAPTRFILAVVDNMDRLAPVCESIIEETKVPEKFEAFDKDRRALLESCARIGTDGKPVINANNEYDIHPSKIQYLSAEMEKLTDKYQDVLNDFESLQKMNEDLMQEKIDIEISTIHIDTIPDDIGLTPDGLRALRPIIRTDEP